MGVVCCDGRGLWVSESDVPCGPDGELACSTCHAGEMRSGLRQ